MAASLRPAVSGASAKYLRRVTTLHGAGLMVGAIVMSLALALLGSIVTAMGMRLILLIPVLVAVALAVLQSIGVRLPQSRWQVPEYWRRTLDAGTLPVIYGAILGLGVFTAVVVGAFWVFLAETLRYPAPVAHDRISPGTSGSAPREDIPVSVSPKIADHCHHSAGYSSRVRLA